MSRVGCREIEIPAGVQVNINDKLVNVKGPLGENSMNLVDNVIVVHEDNKLKVKISNDSMRPMWGTTQALLSNMVKGVHKGFTKTIELIGVGYKGSVSGQVLTMKLGYSHDVVVNIPANIKVNFPSQNVMEISSCSKEDLGAFGAKIKSLRAPDPYKGKGLFYKGEFILRKEGKKKK